MKQTSPIISFITICYNGLNDTCELIESLRTTIHSVSYEIIVVDNASRQDEARMIQERYPLCVPSAAKRTSDSREATTSGYR